MIAHAHNELMLLPSPAADPAPAPVEIATVDESLQARNLVALWPSSTEMPTATEAQ